MSFNKLTKERKKKKKKQNPCHQSISNPYWEEKDEAAALVVRYMNNCNLKGEGTKQQVGVFFFVVVAETAFNL
ncbi:hypothetical protein QQP08_020347 [Theobroma cacao]|nr:hypothetical protein QQP08_020347 [Theobroma cacao]